MANDNTIKTITSVDIEKYHNGQLTAREMHAMEKAALDDPFLADALEGYTVPGVNASADIAELKKRLEERTSKNRVIPMAPVQRSSVPWLRAAAMIILVAGAAFLIYRIGFTDNKDQNIAINSAPEPNSEKSIDSNQAGHRILDQADSVVSEKLSATKTAPSIQNNIDKDIKAQDDQQIKADYKPDNEDQSNKNAFKVAPPVVSELASGELKQGKRAEELNTRRPDTTSNQGYYATNDRNKDRDGVADKFDDRKKEKAFIASAPRKQVPPASQGIVNPIQQNQASSVNVFRGRVTDANNNALPFANITNTVDNVGTYSDAKGNFTLISPDSALNVQVRSVGFENNTRQLQATRDNQVIMQEDNRSLSEVVISNNSNNRANALNRSRNNTIAHEEPEPVDGWSNYDIYVANNINMPDTLQRMPSRGGEVALSFDVNSKGEPINITVDRSLCESCDKEAIRLLKEGPKWKQKSKKRKRTSVTISF